MAAAALRRGELVVFPTETLYGLGADATAAAAVERLVAARGRTPGKPILVLVRDLAMALAVATEVPAAARRLAARFWPGPLTLVLPARAELPPALTAGTGTVGVRVSSHPLAAALVAALGRPVTAPSANPPGAEPPRRLAEARAYFADAVAAWIDGGTLPGGASTVAAVEDGRVRVLRAGTIAAAALEAVLAEEGR
ncbi:MAG TPA: L-threonylcarbamoyladenylate synthase [Candidatus Binatia bacterium]|nr:L-threonylcarbamoyladenylate synthase [Candidatus Binatia bacterium]